MFVAWFTTYTENNKFLNFYLNSEGDIFRSWGNDCFTMVPPGISLQEWFAYFWNGPGLIQINRIYL